ncbi:hypothetical protein Q8A67_012772 [Cirrhinus molitorella]|uniref:FAS1 domain-containing protein n=1 Tax=Cirrhinus molitorella TaxID=172907 RepID=A0AA88PNE0_9TELE|nr:hypothetical protein Q8A67_012772 [Cirrhinus molitorella]
MTSSRYINDCYVIDSDILASNGVIHVLQGPLKAPPPPSFHLSPRLIRLGWALANTISTHIKQSHSSSIISRKKTSIK